MVNTMKHKISAILLTFFLLFGLINQVFSEIDKNNITLKVSTLGLGIDYLHSLSESSDIRLNLNAWNREIIIDKTDVEYDANLKLKNFGVIYDYYPGASIFRVSAGIYYSGDSFDITAKPISSASYTFGGNHYSATDIGDVSGGIDFKKFAPYIGIGGGSSPNGDGIFGTGFAFAFDIGTLYTSYDAELTTSHCNLPTIVCTELVRDVEIERLKLHNELNDIKWYPVVALGLSFKF